RKPAAAGEMHAAHWNGQLRPQAQLLPAGIGQHEGTATNLFSRTVEKQFGRLQDGWLDARIGALGEDAEDGGRLPVEEFEQSRVILGESRHVSAPSRKAWREWRQPAGRASPIAERAGP